MKRLTAFDLPANQSHKRIRRSIDHGKTSHTSQQPQPANTISLLSEDEDDIGVHSAFGQQSGPFELSDDEVEPIKGESKTLQARSLTAVLSPAPRSISFTSPNSLMATKHDTSECNVKSTTKHHASPDKQREPLRLGNSILGDKHKTSATQPARTFLANGPDSNPATSNPLIQSPDDGLFVKQTADSASDRASANRQDQRQLPCKLSGELDTNESLDVWRNILQDRDSDRIDQKSRVAEIGFPGQVRPVEASVNARKAAAHQRKLGEILLIDLLLLIWLNDKWPWPQILAQYREHTGDSRSKSTLQKRLRSVRKALCMAEILPASLLKASAGDIEALKQINTIVLDKVGNTLDRFDKVKTIQKPTSSLGSQTRDDPVGHASRPTVSGKQPSWDMLNLWASAYDEEDADIELPQSERQESDDRAEAEHAQFTYQVQRRECRSNNEQDIDDQPWYDVNDSYTSSAKANAAASGKVLLYQSGHEPIVDGARSSVISTDVDNTGLVTCQYSSSAGIVQTRIQRRLQTFYDHTQAVDTANWHPRTVYAVKARIKHEVVDNAVSGRQRTTEIEEQLVNGQVCAHLQWANEQAISHYVDKTFHSGAKNLDVRDWEKATLAKEHKDRLCVEGEHASFKAEHRSATRSITVWVEALELVGPRNL